MFPPEPMELATPDLAQTTITDLALATLTDLATPESPDLATTTMESTTIEPTGTSNVSYASMDQISNTINERIVQNEQCNINYNSNNINEDLNNMNHSFVECGTLLPYLPTLNDYLPATQKRILHALVTEKLENMPNKIDELKNELNILKIIVNQHDVENF